MHPPSEDAFFFDLLLADTFAISLLYVFFIVFT